MDLTIELFTVNIRPYPQYWFGLLGINIGYFDGYLFYIENTAGMWKFDIFFLRPLFVKAVPW